MVAMVLLVGGIILFGFVSVVAGVSQAGAAIGRLGLQELTVSGTPGAPKIVEVPLEGLIVSGGATGLEGDSVGVLRAMLERAAEDSQVRGVILAVNSGGGGITASDVMRKALDDFRKQTARPVVALLGDVAASGAYYVACGSDYMVAHPTTITGSIGVLMPLYDASGLLKKIGVSDLTIKSGPFKDIASPTAARTPEQWQKDKAILEGVIGQMHDRFVQVVAEGRHMDLEAVRRLADGRIFTSLEAKENGLIDAVGYEEDAVQKVKDIQGLQAVHVVRYRRTPSFLEVLVGRQQGLGIRLLDDLPLELRQIPLYLWRPSSYAPVDGTP
jgi:protease-4